MSDPVTNVEIEDVLSSIRRLVSEDSRVKPAASAGPANRLVLTPALRVKDDAALPESTGESQVKPVLLNGGHVPSLNSSSEGPVFEDFTGTEPETNGEAMNASAISAADAAGARISAEARDVLTLDETARTDVDAVDHDESVSVEVSAMEDTAVEDRASEELAEDQTEPTQELDKEAPSDHGAGTVAKMVQAEVARAIDHAFDQTALEAFAADDDAQSAGTRNDTNMHEDASPSKDTGALDAVAKDDTEEPGEEGGQLSQDRPENQEPEAATSSSLETKIAALEQMVAQKSEDYDADTFEPDAQSIQPTFVHRPTETLEWQDHDPLAADETPSRNIQPEPQADPQPAPKPEHAKTPPAWFAEDAGMIDEDMLRDMVSEIVRHELQGALGERITRNVRKLVRREIHRVLMSQEFD